MLNYECENGAYDVSIYKLTVGEREESASRLDFSGKIVGLRDESRIEGHVWVREGRADPEGEVRVVRIIHPGGPPLGVMQGPDDEAAAEILAGLLLALDDPDQEFGNLLASEMDRICG